MLFGANTLKKYKLSCKDGDIGSAKEFYFDDHHWTVRYLVADTGNWLTGRQVLISPHSITGISSDNQRVLVDLTKQKIENSPSIETDVPVSEQFEEAYYGYYGMPVYWGGPYMWGGYPYMMPGVIPVPDMNISEEGWDRHLRSTNVVTHYNIQATDGELGQVEDFLIDESTWAIRFLVIDTHSRWLGKKILISPKWIEKISWAESSVLVNLTEDAIRSAPDYNDKTEVTQDYETELYTHFDLDGDRQGESILKAIVL
jgi:hypothetical protein